MLFLFTDYWYCQVLGFLNKIIYFCCNLWQWYYIFIFIYFYLSTKPCYHIDPHVRQPDQIVIIPDKIYTISFIMFGEKTYTNVFIYFSIFIYPFPSYGTRTCTVEILLYCKFISLIESGKRMSFEGLIKLCCIAEYKKVWKTEE